MEKIVVIGAGPAGLTAAYELLTRNKNKYEVIVLEETNCIGGISKTVNYKGNRMDMGGHRFFSKSKKVNDWWDSFLPTQGKKSYDDIILNRDANVVEGGPDPENVDDVMLLRHRVSRILFSGMFYDYPISLKLETFTNMGLLNTIKCGLSYITSLIRKLPEDNLENFYINRFGRKLYEMFFEYYTYNLWGRHPKDIDASWGAQRVKGISIIAIIKNVFSKIFTPKNRHIETSLIEEFKYPKLGPGELWEVVERKIETLGGKVLMESKVIGLSERDDKILSVTYIDKNGKEEIINEVFSVISSMPIKDLILDIDSAPSNIKDIAKNLPYRDYITVGILLNKINLKNKTKIKTIGNIIPDNWIYVQDRNVKLGRMQIYNNWSPYMIKDIENTIWIGLEYFVNENDEYWNMSEEAFTKFAISEMIKLRLIDDDKAVLDSHVEKVKKAYPAYFDSYDKIDEVIDYVNKIDNLYCVGRNGQHRYNNIDHSMITSFEAVNCIITNNKDKSKIWNVNTESEYHESK